MISILLLLIGAFLAITLWFFLLPVRYGGRLSPSDKVIEPPDGYVYSYVLHIHTQFSHDSLGKPEDVMRARDSLRIDYAIVTDHDNDAIGKFADDRLIAGREVKVNDGEGNLKGDLLEVGDLRIIAHNFRQKYRWRLERREDYLIELVDLRDALLERKLSLILYTISGLLLYPVLGRRVLKNLTRLIDPELYVKRFFEEGWRSKVVGGLDHHVKLYFREVGRRVLIPSYTLSFSLMRNFVLTDVEVKRKEDLLEAIRRGRNLISFSEKPSFVWTEGGKIKAYSPFSNTFMVILSSKGKELRHLGSNLELLPDEKGYYIVLGYRYAFRIWRFVFGVRPLFVSDLLEV